MRKRESRPLGMNGRIDKNTLMQVVMHARFSIAVKLYEIRS
ncbi:hypothetical protein FF011L_20060 [Roseimaritima multifibrata]|uniref:Uncharacterized protein n=1 Tax=Roseimaritima multifibrata TaxID=1930274 RepID=A0A517MEC2_9BACT|nr:hypothetical protein FF011L_20060 [Roseimaritima multifibrata]